MSPSIMTTPAAVFQFVKDLRKYGAELEGDTSRMKTRLSQLHEQWRDQKYRRLDGDLKALAQIIRKTQASIDNYARQLEIYARKGAETERSPIGSGS